MTADDLLDDETASLLMVAGFAMLVIGFLLFGTTPGHAMLDGMARLVDALTGGVF